MNWKATYPATYVMICNSLSSKAGSIELKSRGQLWDEYCESLSSVSKERSDGDMPECFKKETNFIFFSLSTTCFPEMKYM